jgi:hypothetical protein
MARNEPRMRLTNNLPRGHRVTLPHIPSFSRLRMECNNNNNHNNKSCVAAAELKSDELRHWYFLSTPFTSRDSENISPILSVPFHHKKSYSLLNILPYVWGRGVAELWPQARQYPCDVPLFVRVEVWTKVCVGRQRWKISRERKKT